MIRALAFLLLLPAPCQYFDSQVRDQPAPWGTTGPELLRLSTQDPAARIDAVLEGELKAGRLPGAAVAIARDGKVVYAGTCGKADREKDLAVKPDTVFRIGSITKQFSAAAILLLRDDGKLSIDDPLSKFLPDYPRGKDVTVRQLLTHTSGIKSYTSLKEWRPTLAEDRAPEELIKLFRDLPFDFEPGEKFAYNNSGYFLLGMIVEKASGLPYGDYLRKKIFEPLGLENTRVDAPGLEVKGRATGYKPAPKGFVPDDPISMTQPGAAGAMISTVGDLLAWDAALHSGKVLKQASLDEMLAPVKLKDGKESRYGFGIGVAGEGERRVIEHGGGINGFASYLGRFPTRGLSVAVLVNRPGYDAKGLAMKALKAFEGD